jgi:uncharacterized OB-fold protein
MGRMIPIPDRDTAPYWAALANGVLKLQHCGDCGHWTWPARPICSNCQSDNMAWEPVKGTGEVYSWVVVHRGMASEPTPYVIAQVRLDEQKDIYIPAVLRTTVPVRQGLRVRAITEKLSDNVGDLIWVPA